MSNIVIPERIPWPVRLLGARFKDGPHAYRMRWGELNFKRGAALDLCMFEEGFSLHLHALWCSAFIKLPVLQRWHREPRDMMESWGFSLGPESGLHLHWGTRTKVVTMAWRDWVQTAHDVRLPDGSWVPFVGSWEDREPDDRYVEQHPYRYVLNSGEVQNRTASIHVERRTRKLRWLQWLPWGRTTYAISVDFDGEVGGPAAGRAASLAAAIRSGRARHRWSA